MKEEDMKEEKFVWVVSGVSESTDHYGPKAYDHKPSDGELSELSHSWDGHFGDLDGYEPGSGDYGSFVHLDIQKVVIDRKKTGR